MKRSEEKTCPVNCHCRNWIDNISSNPDLLFHYKLRILKRAIELEEITEGKISAIKELRSELNW